MEIQPFSQHSPLSAVNSGTLSFYSQVANFAVHDFISIPSFWIKSESHDTESHACFYEILHLTLNTGKNIYTPFSLKAQQNSNT